MSFDDWYKSKYIGNDPAFKMHIESAWDAAIDDAAKLVAANFDELEPWIEEKDIRNLSSSQETVAKETTNK